MSRRPLDTLVRQLGTPGRRNPQRFTPLVLETAFPGAPWWINPVEYGADPTGVAYSDSPIQSALDDASDGRVVIFPPGTYKVAGQLDIDQGQSYRIWGCGADSSIITCDDGTVNIFRVDQVEPVTFEYLTITRSVASTAGANIVLTDGTTENYGSTVNDCIIANGYIGIDILRANRYKILNSYIADHYIAGLRIQNQYNADSGDGLVNGCTLDTSRGGTTYGILHHSGGGLRLISTKILSHTFGYDLELLDGVFTGVLLMAGCSIEGQGTRCVLFAESGATTGGYSQIAIVGNQFAGPPVLLEAAGAITVANILNITGNTFSLADSGKGISLSRANKVLIDANIILGNGSTSTQPIGIEAGVNVSNIHFGRQQFSGILAANEVVSSATPFTDEEPQESTIHFSATKQGNYLLPADANWHGVGSWGSAIRLDTGYSFNGTTGELTISNAGWYKIYFQSNIKLSVSNSAATHMQIRFEEDSGGGFADISGTLNEIYLPDDTTHGYGTAVASKKFQFSAGDKLRIAARNTDASWQAQIQALGTSWWVESVPDPP